MNYLCLKIILHLRTSLTPFSWCCFCWVLCCIVHDNSVKMWLIISDVCYWCFSYKKVWGCFEHETVSECRLKRYLTVHCKRGAANNYFIFKRTYMYITILVKQNKNVVRLSIMLWVFSINMIGQNPKHIPERENNDTIHLMVSCQW